MLIVDAHLDLAMNAMEWNRDLKRPVSDLRNRENGMTDKPDRGNNMVSLPAMREGEIGLVVATQIARFVEPENPFPGWNSPEQAWAQTQAQRAWYKCLEEEGELISVYDLETLDKVLDIWSNAAVEKNKKPIGYILSLEGADSLVKISYLEKAYGYGLRALGPAHYGPGRYAGGTGTTTGLTSSGKTLLKEMDSLNMILDVTHLTDLGFSEAIEIFQGPVWASHHNCRKLVNNQRQLTDEQIRIIVERDGVIGGVLDAWMLTDGWERGISEPQKMNINLSRLLEHYDHICQIAGNARHIAIGSDLDGAFGKEQAPFDMETIADLQKLPDLLKKRGYTDEEMAGVLHGNWIRFIRNAWN